MSVLGADSAGLLQSLSRVQYADFSLNKKGAEYMKPLSKLKFAALAVVSLGVIGGLGSAIAQSTYGKLEVNQSSLIVLSAPGGRLVPHQLIVIEQLNTTRPCWSESGNRPTEVTPLLLDFDFTGICNRATDSNGYSVRLADNDQGPRMRLQIRESEGNLFLFGVPNDGSAWIVIGQTYGKTASGYEKIILNSGWRVTKRTYQGQTLGHYYLTHDMTLAQLQSAGGSTPTPTPTPTGTATPTPTPTPTPVTAFRDVQGDIYAAQIARAAEIGFVAGFEDGTFRPTQAVTREQAVSMIIEALRLKVPNLTVPTQVGSAPFPDVAVSRWSAAKIQFAKTNGIVSGDQTGTFRPGANVTRVELMAMIRRAVEYQKRAVGLNPELSPTQTPFLFSDTTGHWGAALIATMSGYCGIASPLNERGTAFVPDSPALRNYSSAAIVRMFDCGQPQSP